MSWKQDLGAWTTPNQGEDAAAAGAANERKRKATSDQPFFPRHLDKTQQRLSYNLLAGATPRSSRMSGIDLSGEGSIKMSDSLNATQTPRNTSRNSTLNDSSILRGQARPPMKSSQWVTVSGVSHKYITFVMAVMEGRFGKIEGHIWQGDAKNWFHVKFISPLHAEQAVVKGGLLVAQGSFNKAATVVRLSWCTDNSVLNIEDASFFANQSRLTATPSRLSASNHFNNSLNASGLSTSQYNMPEPYVSMPHPGNLNIDDVLTQRCFRNLNARGAFERPIFREIKWWASYTFWSTLLFMLVVALLIWVGLGVYRTIWSVDTYGGYTGDYYGGLGDGVGGGHHGYYPGESPSEFCDGEFCQ